MKKSSHTFEGQAQIRSVIEGYLSQRGMTSTRKIAAYVKEKTGLGVSPSTIARLVRGFGYARETIVFEKLEEGKEWVKK